MTRVHVPPPLFAGGALLLQQLVAVKRPTKASRLVAASVVAGAVWLLGGAALEFRRRATTMNPVDVGADELVTTGPNRFTRNPMYLGMAAVLVANAVRRRSPAALLPVAAFVGVINQLQIPAEEAILRERFPEAYAEYVRVTPRWLLVR